mmetsp:Transcript_109951/g.275426  ORF Transcript_109951/g.275426 Transcript_109951/m.275426 type:complete len:253 (-) Transcript_109951:105-863(-)
MMLSRQDPSHNGEDTQRIQSPPLRRHDVELSEHCHPACATGDHKSTLVGGHHHCGIELPHRVCQEHRTRGADEGGTTCNDERKGIRRPDLEKVVKATSPRDRDQRSRRLHAKQVATNASRDATQYKAATAAPNRLSSHVGHAQKKERDLHCDVGQGASGQQSLTHDVQGVRALCVGAGIRGQRRACHEQNAPNNLSQRSPLAKRIRHEEDVPEDIQAAERCKQGLRRLAISSHLKHWPTQDIENEPSAERKV